MNAAFEDQHRQTGRTTRQMDAASKGAIYVWPEDRSVRIAQKMARDLGRDDLEVIPERLFRIGWLERKSSPMPQVVIDHATNLTHEGWRAVAFAIHCQS